MDLYQQDLDILRRALVELLGNAKLFAMKYGGNTQARALGERVAGFVDEERRSLNVLEEAGQEGKLVARAPQGAGAHGLTIPR